MAESATPAGEYLEQARALVGTILPQRTGSVAVNDGMIQLMCSAIEDRNPRYWRDGESPPSMVLTWVLDMPWDPESGHATVPGTFPLPLPGDQVVNVSHEVEMFARIFRGDRLSMSTELISVSDEKTTKVGKGHFVETRIIIINQNGAKVAVISNSAFKYRPS